MKKKLLKALANSSLVRNFVAKPSPKWMVLLADLILITFSCALTLTFGAHTNHGEVFLFTPFAKACFEFLL